MSVFRKENGDLAKKAGIGIIDNILNKFSNRAISNGAVTNQLSANDNLFKAAYQNGKYGFIIDGTFYEIGGGGMLLDTSNVVSLIGVASYTTRKDGELKVAITNGTTGDILINGKSIFTTTTPDSSTVGILTFSYPIPTGTIITNTIDTSTSKARIVKFYPYL